MIKIFSPPLELLWQNFVEFHMRNPFKLRAIAIVGLVTFPLYFFVWTKLFPQQYESITLRSVGFILSLLGALERWWPRRIKPYFLAFSYVSILYGLPIFFTAMTLLNDGSPPWLMSLMAAFLFVALLYDLRNAIIVSFAGSILGYMLYFAISGHSYLPINYLMSIPILAFSVLAVMTLSYSESLIAQGKIATAHLLASHIAHEMRTHLMGIRLCCEKFSAEFEDYVATNNSETFKKTASDLSLKEEPPRHQRIRDREILQMREALVRIENHAATANLVIEMLLANASLNRIDPESFSEFSLKGTIANAVDNFNVSGKIDDVISFEVVGDVKLFGSEPLMLHVFFNLIKNALTAIAAKGGGKIRIFGEASATHVFVYVSDTGKGIAPALMPLIFVPFVSSDQRMQGTGLGLSFCKIVIEGFSGTITCKSIEGEGTTFTIRLPLPSKTSSSVSAC